MLYKIMVGVGFLGSALHQRQKLNDGVTNLLSLGNSQILSNSLTNSKKTSFTIFVMFDIQFNLT